MKKTFALSIVSALLLVFSVGCANRRSASAKGNPAPTESRAEVVNRMADASSVLNELVSTPDNSIPDTVLSRAKCVAVVPSMVKGGFVIGGQHGRGVVTCRTGNGWSAPAFVTITGGSWGAQIGAESVDLVLLFMSDKGMQSLLGNSVKLGADASVAAGPLGRQASAGTDVAMNAEILSYSRTRGLFAGLDLNGAAVRTDEDSTRALYGKYIGFHQLLGGSVPPPEGSRQFLATVERDFAAANAKK